MESARVATNGAVCVLLMLTTILISRGVLSMRRQRPEDMEERKIRRRMMYIPGGILLITLGFQIWGIWLTTHPPSPPF
jgi:hypothetical protein